MKKIILLTFLQLAVIQAFSQLSFFNRTGEGFAVGVSYSDYSKNNYSSTTITGTASDRFSRVFSANIEFVSTTVDYYWYGKQSANTLIPSITIQVPNDEILGIAAHVGYANSKLTGDIPTLLLGLEIYRRINSEGILQLIPFGSLSKSVFLEDTYQNTKPVLGVGANLAVRLGKKIFLVAGPQMSFSDGDNMLSVNTGLVVQ